jgi:mannose-1-phosphate guanylyltransferase
MGRFLLHAMILAAGFGTRLKPLTDRRPKCLMPVMNQPLLELWLEKLAFCSRVVVNTHYLAGMVHGFLEARPLRGPAIVINHEPEILGTGGGLAGARKLLGDEPFLLANADVIASQEMAALGRAHQPRHVATLGLVDDPRFNTVALDQGGRLLGFKGDSGLPTNARWLTYSGLAVISPRLLEFLPPTGYSTLVQGLHLAAATNETVQGVLLDGFWDDLGSPQSLLGLHRRLAADPPRGLESLAPEALPLIHPQARVHPTARVEGVSVLGPGAVLEAGAVVSDSLMLDGARAAADSRVSQAILGDGFIAQGEISGGAHA